jgi:hypothetical protein
VYIDVIRTPSVKRSGGLAQLVKDRVKRYVFPDYILARRQYYYRNGFYPDLINPKDLSEKILWLKLYDRSPLHTRCADKILVRDHVASRIGAQFLAPKILATYDLDEVGPDRIREERFVIKTNHDQGGVFICLDRARFDWARALEQIRARALVNKYYEFQERQYRDIRPGVLVESFIEGEEGRNAVELKVNCFEGKPQFIQVIVDRFEKRRHVNYDLNWRRMDLHGRSLELEYDLPRPRHLDLVLEAAETLAAPFLFCRVDFLLDAASRPWFGEITFHPAAGLVRYNPPEMERALGDLIDLRRFAEFAEAQRRIWFDDARSQRRLSGALRDAR